MVATRKRWLKVCLVGVGSQAKALAVSMLVMTSLVGCAQRDDPSSAPNQAAEMMRDQWELKQRYTQECMADLGFDYEAQPYQPLEGLGLVYPNPFELTLEEAAADGFGIVSGALVNAESTPPLSEVEGDHIDLDEWPYYEALWGDGTNSGCIGIADRRLEEEFDLSAYPAVDAWLQATNKVLEDPRLPQFWQTWAECMATDGYTAVDIYDLEMQFSARVGEVIVWVPPEWDETLQKFVGDHYEIDQTAVASLHAAEVAAALAATSCLEPLRSSWDEIYSDAFGEQ